MSHGELEKGENKTVNKKKEKKKLSTKIKSFVIKIKNCGSVYKRGEAK